MTPRDGKGAMRARRLLIVAGEPSGDVHGAALVEALAQRHPHWVWYGMGGERLERAGVHCLQRLEDVSVVGLTEVVARFDALWGAYRSMARAIDGGPDAVIFIDFPEFNLRLARRARRRGLPVIYYVSPQVWAWRRHRIRLLGRLVDRMLVLFPFEKAIYDAAGIPARHVGHPLVDEIPPAWTVEGRLRARARAEVLCVALEPGSRPGEVRRILPTLLEGAAELGARRPARFELVRAPGLDHGELHRHLQAWSAPARDKAAVRIVEHDSGWEQRVHLAWVASGTATLDTALRGVPMIVGYRLSPMSFAVARRLVRVDHVAMVNLIARRRLVPELLQDRLAPGALVDETRRLWEDEEAYRRVLEGLAEVRRALDVGRPAAAAAADAVDELLEEVGR